MGSGSEKKSFWPKQINLRPIFSTKFFCFSVASKVWSAPPRLQGLPAQEALPPVSRQGQGLPQGWPLQTCPPDMLPRLQGRHDPHCPRGRPARLQGQQEGGRRGGHHSRDAAARVRRCGGLHWDAARPARAQDRLGGAHWRGVQAAILQELVRCRRRPAEPPREGDRSALFSRSSDFYLMKITERKGNLHTQLYPTHDPWFMSWGVGCFPNLLILR